MLYPSRTEYNLAIKYLDRFVLAPHFQGGKAHRITGNRLRAYSGGYSRVYPIQVGQKTIALRCWIADIGRAEERYRKIKTYLDANPLPYFVDFGYIERGIAVNGKIYPIIYMEWIDGLRLNKFLDQNINDSGVLLQTATEFQKMVEILHQKRISHGDLQEGNILIQRHGNSLALKLIDYDSLFVPSLQGWPEEIVGLPTYQHPKRAHSKQLSEKSDFFSELVIYLSLCAYAEEPSLWKMEQEQKLLFSDEDFIHPEHSPIFKYLKSLSPKIQYLTAQLEEFCLQTDLNQLPPLEQVLAKASIDTKTALRWDDFTHSPQSVPLKSPNSASSQQLDWHNFEHIFLGEVKSSSSSSKQPAKSITNLDNFFNTRVASKSISTPTSNLSSPKSISFKPKVSSASKRKISHQRFVKGLKSVGLAVLIYFFLQFVINTWPQAQLLTNDYYELIGMSISANVIRGLLGLVILCIILTGAIAVMYFLGALIAWFRGR